MAEPNWKKEWTKFKKHRKATERDWRSGKAREWSRQHESHSQYNPRIFSSDESVKEIELRCVREKNLIRASANKRTHFMPTTVIVGVCCGNTTEYVFAEWHSTGAIHGRPICKSCLIRLGVAL